jgi:hypothetical protein
MTKKLIKGIPRSKSKTIIIYSAGNTDFTTNGERLAHFYKRPFLYTDWNGKDKLPAHDAIVLTNLRQRPSGNVIFYGNAMRQLNGLR